MEEIASRKWGTILDFWGFLAVKEWSSNHANCPSHPSMTTPNRSTVATGLLPPHPPKKILHKDAAHSPTISPGLSFSTRHSLWTHFSATQDVSRFSCSRGWDGFKGHTVFCVMGLLRLGMKIACVCVCVGECVQARTGTFWRCVKHKNVHVRIPQNRTCFSLRFCVCVCVCVCVYSRSVHSPPVGISGPCRGAPVPTST